MNLYGLPTNRGVKYMIYPAKNTVFTLFLEADISCIMHLIFLP
jgi:hypothetical protein